MERESDALELRRQLVQLGLRRELMEPITLSSGKQSKVFWDVRQLYNCPLPQRLVVLAPLIKRLKVWNPDHFSGIPTAGFYLASDFSKGIWGEDDFIGPALLRAKTRILLVDDVLTTGRTIELALDGWAKKVARPLGIVILVNRSPLTKIQGIPIISGIYADPVA